MTITIGSIEMKGMNGTIQPPKPVFEKFVGLGDTQPYIQRLRTESNESKVQLWDIVADYAAVETLLGKFKENVGIKNEITWDGNTPNYDVYILDYVVTTKQGAGSKWLIQVDTTIITSDRDY